MDAIHYLIRRQLINRIKRTFSRPLSAIITVLACIFFCIGPIMTFFYPHHGMDVGEADTMIAGLMLFIGVVMINAMLSQQSGLYTLSDANFLFPSPVDRKHVLLYAIIQTLPGSLLTAVFSAFYFPFILNLNFLSFLAVLLFVILFFSDLFLLYYMLYIAGITRPGLLKKSKLILWALVGLIAAAFLFVAAKNHFRFGTAAKTFFTSPFYNALPFFGWAKWGILSVSNGEVLTGAIPAALLLTAAAVVFAAVMLHDKSDFYEQALNDSYKVQRAQENLRKGNVDQRSLLKARSKGAKIRFQNGAAAIFSRQLLEMSKASMPFNLRELLMDLAYAAIAIFGGLGVNFALGMIVFASIANTLNDSWHMEFKKPYVFLIPENSFKKLLFSLLPGILKTCISGGLSLTLTCIVFRESPQNTASYLFMFIGYAVLFVFTEVFTYRLMGAAASAPALMFLRMLFVMAAAVPSGIVMIILAVLSSGHPPMLELSASNFIINIAFAALLAFFSRKIFENSEIMS